MEEEGVGVSLPVDEGVGEGITGLGRSLGRLARISSPGT